MAAIKAGPPWVTWYSASRPCFSYRPAALVTGTMAEGAAAEVRPISSFVSTGLACCADVAGLAAPETGAETAGLADTAADALAGGAGPATAPQPLTPSPA